MNGRQSTRGWRVALAMFGAGVLLACGTPAAAPRAPVVTAQGGAPSEKESRTAAQRKIDSQLLFEIYRKRGQAEEKRVPPGATGVRIDTDGRARVDLRVEVTPAFEKKVKDLGSAIISTSVEYHSIVAWIPLLKLEGLAEDQSVRAIVPAAEATTNTPVK